MKNSCYVRKKGCESQEILGSNKSSVFQSAIPQTAVVLKLQHASELLGRLRFSN